MYKIKTVTELYNYVNNANNVGKIRVNSNLAEAAASLPTPQPSPTYTTAWPAVSHPLFQPPRLCCRSSLLLGLTSRSPSLSYSLPRPRISYLFYSTLLTVIHISTSEPLHQCPQHNPLLTLSSYFPSSSAKCLNYQPA